MNEPLVSVILPVFNGEDYISDAIESVYKQTYKHIELIIINDGSSDNSQKKIYRLINSKDYLKRFKSIVYEYQENEGVASAYNKGIKLSKGEYISFLAQDDIYVSYFLEEAVSTISKLNEDYCMVCGDASFIDENGKRIYLKPHALAHLVDVSHTQKPNYTNSFLAFTTYGRDDFDYRKDFGSYSSLLMSNYIPINASVVKRKAIEKVGYFTVGNFIEDWDLWLRLARYYRFFYIDKTFLYYRWHVSNSVKKHRTKILISSIETLLNEYEFAKENGSYNIWRGSLILHINLLHKHFSEEQSKLSFLNRYLLSININNIKSVKKTINKIRTKLTEVAHA